MKKRVLLIVAVLMAVILTSCASQKNGAQKNGNSIKVSYQIKKADKSVAKKSVTVKKGTTVLTGLRKCWKVKTEKQMVTVIAGHSQEPDLDQYWIYSINGKEAKKGAAEQKLHNKDQVVFTLKDIAN